MDNFIEWLQQELDERGWSQRELGRRAGITSSSINMVLMGGRGPTWDFCAAIAKPLDVSPIFVLRLAGLLPQPADLKIAGERIAYLVESDERPKAFEELWSVVNDFGPDEFKSLFDYAEFLRNKRRSHG